MKSIVTSVTEVFSALLEWFSSAMTDVGAIFFNAESGLTLIGTITIIGLGFAVTLKVFNMIRSMLRLH